MAEDKTIKKGKVYHATWHTVSDPLHYVECPHCKATIFMSTPKVIEKLISWAKRFKK